MAKKITYGSDGQTFTLGSKIRHIRKSLKITQKEFAESLGIVQGFLSAIETGKKTPSDTLLIALQHLYKVNPAWTHSGEEENKLSSQYQSISQGETLTSIPFLKNLPANKEEFQLSAHFDSYISLPGVPRGGFAFEYTGDYMVPTIRDGDIIVINPDRTLTSGNIGLIVGKWGEPYLRRYREIHGEQYFSSDNASYVPFQPNASTKILGVVEKVWREIKI
jgi:transcriptional regulator with XRE-family HTH domain